MLISVHKKESLSPLPLLPSLKNKYSLHLLSPNLTFTYVLRHHPRPEDHSGEIRQEWTCLLGGFCSMEEMVSKQLNEKIGYML